MGDFSAVRPLTVRRYRAVTARGSGRNRRPRAAQRAAFVRTVGFSGENRPIPNNSNTHTSFGGLLSSIGPAYQRAENGNIPISRRFLRATYKGWLRLCPQGAPPRRRRGTIDKSPILPHEQIAKSEYSTVAKPCVMSDASLQLVPRHL